LVGISVMVVNTICFFCGRIGSGYFGIAHTRRSNCGVSIFNIGYGSWIFLRVFLRTQLFQSFPIHIEILFIDV
jgi:hypothetical protein